VVLSLALNRTKLKPQFALDLKLKHPVGNGFVPEEVTTLYQLNGLTHVSFALFKHAKLLETKGHVVVCDEGEEAVPPGVLEVKDFEDALIFLKEDVGFFKLLLLDEVVSDFSELRQ
jgi:hypothetical protein